MEILRDGFLHLRSGTSRSRLFLLLSLVLLLSYIRALKVIGGNVTLAEGATAVLPCKLIESDERLSQISWQKSTREKPETVFFFTFSDVNGENFVNGRDPRMSFIGNFNERNGSMRITDIALKDEGTYTCIFFLFPNGRGSTQIPLTVLVPPVTGIRFENLLLGDQEVELVACFAVASKPPSEVRWLFGDLGNDLRETTNVTQHPNGTSTTVASLFGVPSREINRRQVQCVVSNAALQEEKSQAVTLEFVFPPTNVAIKQTSENTFKCVSEAHPEPDFIWTRSDRPDFRVKGAELVVPSGSSGAIYRCEVSNVHGKRSGQVYVQGVPVCSGSCIAGWVLFGILAALNVVIIVGLYKAGLLESVSNRFTRRSSHAERYEAPASPSSPERRPAEAEETAPL